MTMIKMMMMMMNTVIFSSRNIQPFSVLALNALLLCSIPESANSSKSRLRALRTDYVVSGGQVILPLQATSGVIVTQCIHLLL